MNKLVIIETNNKELVNKFIYDNDVYDVDYAKIRIPFKDTVESLKRILSNKNDWIMATYDKIYLLEFASTYFWDEKENKYEVYLLRDNGLISIHDTTEKEIRKSYSLYRMYWAGAFD